MGSPPEWLHYYVQTVPAGEDAHGGSQGMPVGNRLIAFAPRRIFDDQRPSSIRRADIQT
ncbi:hypothetical protein [Kibdelosporangium philippinense]|uniref:hypothetical protein n=1 Tax=Kibdelosporangium philippinense TaxID=211113 RepID=UPI003614BFC3